MRRRFKNDPVLKLYGYSPESPASIFERIKSGAKPSSLKGDFVFIAEGEDAETGLPLCVFVTTPICAQPYYYHLSGTVFAHGPNVFECCAAAGLKWDWNWTAVAQLALIDHAMGGMSLHPNVHRLPAASVIECCAAKFSVETEKFWREMYGHNDGKARIKDAPEIILEILSESLSEGRASLSLSAGYDSRVLLAALSHLGTHTVTACMGATDSTDPRIAEVLAREVGYPYNRLELEAADYLAHAPNIVRITSGEKVFWHWHTGIYAAKVGFDSKTPHLAGSNGEFARSFYFDKGFIAQALDNMRLNRSDLWLKLKYDVHRRINPKVLGSIDRSHPFFKHLGASMLVKKVWEPMGGFGENLDHFYATQRVRHFIGSGLSLYRSAFPTMSPFLDSRFVRYAASLPRQDKLANRMHRHLVEKLCPKLLAFPCDESGVPMGANPGRFYFLGKKEVRAYQAHTEAQKLPQVMEWAKRGYFLLGGENKNLEKDTALFKGVVGWNLAITMGAIQDELRRSGLD